MKEIYLCKKEDVKYSKIIGEELEENPGYCTIYGDDLEEMSYFVPQTLGRIVSAVKELFSGLDGNITNESITNYVFRKQDNEEFMEDLIETKLVKYKIKYYCTNPYREEYAEDTSITEIKANIIKSILLSE